MLKALGEDAEKAVLPTGQGDDGAALHAGAGLVALRLHRAAALHHAIQPGGAQHLAGKVRALAGHIRHLGAAALVGIGIQVDGGAVGHLCARVGVLVGDRGSRLAALALLQLML